MTEPGALTYCEYFTLSPHDRYVIHVTIRRPKTIEIVEATFDPIEEPTADAVVGGECC